ncbi:MAG: molybdopterin-dependent oxidoreductase, partial [Candidatus Hydrogenedentes bacterium]|nr:molybdopterin-dependent oxidoreductase [Candidatus Hydrogenedentota bacterium]
MNCHEESQPDRHELRESPRYRFEVSRRGFIQSLGAGLLICVQGGQLWAQQARGGQRTIAARLHIGEDGVVTVLTGKVEVGQGARTQLAMAAAEELRVPLDKIAMQMADTSMTPDDGGTYGSRTTPANVPEVRAAAAAARELLLETAAKEWGVARDVLKVDAGVIVETSGGRSLSFGDLAKSVKLAEVLRQRVPTDITLRKPEEWTVLGQPTVRLGTRDIVTGTHRYPSDMRLPNMLYAAIRQSPVFGGTLKSYDEAAIRDRKGVRRVVPLRDAV